MRETKKRLSALVRQVDVLNKVAVETVKRHLRALVISPTIVHVTGGEDRECIAQLASDPEKTYFDPEFDTLDKVGDPVIDEHRREAIRRILGPNAAVRESAFYQLLRRYYLWSGVKRPVRLKPLPGCGTGKRRSHGRNPREST